MRIKRKNGLKVLSIAIVLLLCLALAIGITGAFYQAKRQATGTLSMDQGIIIDYKGFGQTPDEGIWTRDTTTTFLLFNETNAQPGEQIAVNPAGIRANAESVNFYARVKLSYKFYNGETPVELADATKLIKTSSSFFGTNWVESGDGYYYYATGLTLNKFEKGAQTFVDLFATDAKFIIEGAGFTGATSNGEGGGFVVGDTSINKIEVYLTLETLQGGTGSAGGTGSEGGADVETEGWEITTATGETEDENVVELTPEDYTSTTTTDGATGEKTIYTPTNSFVNKYPQYAFTFSLNDTDKTATITGPVGEPTELDIPSRLIINNENENVKKYKTTNIGVGAFKDTDLTSITLGKGVESIGDNAFERCYMLESIEIPDSVKSIGKNVFSVSGLRSITLGNSLESIGEGAFSICEDLTSIDIPDSVTTLGDYLFYGYPGTTALQSITIGTGVTSIGKKMFGYCPDLRSITVKEGNTKYQSAGNCIIETASKTLIAGCKESVIPTDGSVTSIGDCAFSECKGLTSITIPSRVTSIGDNAFASCTGLTSITIPEGVTSIGGSAFNGCSGLTSIEIPDSVTSIGENAFQYCSKLATKISDIGGNWVKESYNTAVSVDTLLRNIDYAIKRA